MDVTQCDLSANETKLDHQALLKVAQIATGHCLEEVAKYQSELRGRLFKEDVTGIHLNAHWLAQEAQQLDISAEVLATLMGSMARREIEIVNKPEVKKF